jgi:hypothetical protein
MKDNNGFVQAFHNLVVECNYCGEDMLIKKSENNVVIAKCERCAENLDTYYMSFERVKHIVKNFNHLFNEELEEIKHA